MSRKKSYITATDQFCGAGGSSQGAVSAGVEVKLAMNHWRLAIDTHNTNFPNTDHDCADMSAADPRRYNSTDILITSPECTNHSLAKGISPQKKQLDMFQAGKIDPAAERSRATMWDVPRFAEYHKYRNIIVENVVDARKWVMFDSWLHAMHALGYEHRCVYLNSMHFFPTPQSRDRMYVVFWQKGQRAPVLDYTPVAWCPRCGKDVAAVQTWKRPDVHFGKYRQQYVYCCPADGAIVEPYYYASFNCIDWSNLGTQIGDRKKELSPNTRRRIEYGLKKYGNTPMAVANYSPGYTRPVSGVAPTVRTVDSTGLLTPFVLNDQHSSGTACRVRHGSNPLDTVTTTPRFKLVMPFIIKEEHTGGEKHIARSVTQAAQTQTTRQSMALIVPHIVEMNRTGKMKEASAPAPTVTAGGRNLAILGAPFLVENKGASNARGITEPAGCITSHEYLGIIQSDAWDAFMTSYYGHTRRPTHFTEELGSVTTKDRNGLVQFKTPVIEDCYYRMLTAFEIKLAMAFDRDYVILGSSRDQVKQAGNAVTPPVMKWLVQRVVDSLK